MKKAIILFAVIGVCLFIAATTYSRMARESAEEELAAEIAGETAPAFADAASFIEKAKMSDIRRAVPEGAVDIAPVVYGSPDAPIIIEEFASFTCSHCANFHRTLMPKVKKELIDTGIAQLHKYSFIRNTQDLEATLLVQCQADNAGRKAFTSSLMRGQEQWAFATNYLEGLETIARVGGMDKASFDKCLKDEAMQNKIVASRQWFDKQVGVDATPYFRIGEEVVKGARNVQDFADAIRKTVSMAPMKGNTAE